MSETEERIVKSVAALTEALEADGCVVGARLKGPAMPGFFNDGCPGEKGKYPVDRIRDWLLEKGHVERPEPGDQSPEAGQGSESAPANSDADTPNNSDLPRQGSVFCPYTATCGQTAMKAFSTKAFYTYYKCPNCGRSDKRLRPGAQEALRRKSEQKPPEEVAAAR